MKRLRNFKITILCRMLIFALMIVPAAAFVIPMTVHAEDPAAPPAPAEPMVEFWKIREYIGNKNAGLNATLGEDLALALQNGAGNNLKDLLSWKDSDLELMYNLWNITKMLGTLMGIMYFLLEMNHAVFLAQSNWTMQSLMTPLLKFGIVICVINYGGTFIGNILGFGNYFLEQVGTYSIDNAGLSQATCDIIKKLGFLEVIVMMIPIFVIVIVSYIVSLIFVYKAFAYKIEVMIRVAITPIVFGDVWDGRNSHAIRWLKKLAGLMLYGGCFILVFRAGTMLLASDLLKTAQNSDSTTAMFSTYSSLGMAKSEGVALWMVVKGTLYGFLIPIAEIGALSLAKNACMEVFG